ncbi:MULTISPECIES: host specificity protein J [unclassified Gilliamella]|uniref:host specificity protein J n=1 Tax=unclassified Gilliamella TaxID=2685620 RepID=UPI00080EDB20|nr:phage tail protein [Gilliamella apicola]OCG35748.1 host specificity protein [Gilliamella apicola]OCG50747.1 host specificity protein [Gilliamella apicola]OCG54272.1 host specificity protein [Gilliamella apicola]
MHLIEGQKGGSKKQHKPYEQPDNLLSTAKLKALIALSEGEIQGDITEQNIYIDNTPLANADGSRNFNGVTWEFRNGSQTQDYIKGIPEISNELRANYIVKANKPWVRSFSNLDLDAIRIKLSLPTHVEYKENGDMVGTVTKYAIDLSTDGSAFETVVNAEFNGKTTSEYQRDHRINLPSAVNGWAIRVRRLTPDSNSNSKLINAFAVSSYAEVIDSKLRYPNTALLYIELDASQFNGAVPKISCKLKGKLVQVPDNYDPVSRTYSGIWRGGFKMAYTNNPAWLAYYLMRDEIAGMGLRIDSTMIDKWSIYQLGQYCDQMVSDGKGGKEPRFACNEYIQSQEDAYTVLKDLVASFRGIIFWGNDQICLTADMPQDEPDFIYHPSNVIGDFAYSGGSYKNRYTSCLVAYSDPNNHYCDDVEAVWDYDLMRRYDVNVMKLTAIGCTSQAEAQRRGRWALLSNAKDEVITFTVGLDGYIPMPARIIGVADPSRSGKENGGRIHAVSGRKITLDRVVDYSAGDRLVINLPDGTAQSRTIKAISTDKKTITVSANYKIEPVAGAVWCIDSDNIAIQYFRVTSISATEKGRFTITAIQHDPDKFKYIDEGIRIESKPITVTPPSSISTPKNIVVSESSYISQGLSIASLNATWDTVEGATNYVAQWRKDNSAWINVGRTNGTNFTVEGVYSGVYEVRVRAVNAIDVSSPWAYSQATSIKGKVGKPDKPIGFTASDDVVFGVDLKWSFPDGSGDTSHTEIQYSTNESEEKALLLSNVTYPSCSYSQTGLSIGQVFFYRARLVDKIGNVSDWTEWVRGISSTNTNDLTDHIFDEIKETDAWNSLIDSVDNAAISSIENAKAIIENALANDTETRRRRVENGSLSAEIKETNSVLLTEKEATAIALRELNSKYGDVSSNLTEFKKTTAEQNSATAQAIQSINTKVGDVSTSISDVSETVNNLNGKISAHRTMKVKIDDKGQQYVAGMTMGVENTDNGMQSNVIFLADKFMVMNQANGNPVPAFIIKDGNVIMNGAIIGRASLNFATISDTIQSENYVPGKSGWRLFKDGNFEINSSFLGGGRIELNGSGLAVFDERNVLRVKLGKL